MISAAEARMLSQHIWIAQLEQIEHGIKETILLGGNYIGYRTDSLEKLAIEWLTMLGYKVEECEANWTKISWEE